MEVLTLDGKKNYWKVPEKIAKGSNRKKSKLHSSAVKLIREKYPLIPIYEEMPVILEGKQKAFFDIWLPTLNMVVEVNGQQHYEFSSLYHKFKWELSKQKAQDRKKIEWCELNDISLAILKYDNTEEWQEILTYECGRTIKEN